MSGKVVSLGEIEEVYCKNQSKNLSKADMFWVIVQLCVEEFCGKTISSC